jgi:hypothetical protein
LVRPSPHEIAADGIVPEQHDLPAHLADLIHDGEPVWDAIDFDVACSRCGYNLRMLAQPRCPECGLEFDWTDVVDRARFTYFEWEQAEGPRTILALLKMLRCIFRPVRFWRRASIHQQVNSGRLFQLLLFDIVGFVALLHGLTLLGYWVSYLLARLAWSAPVWRPLQLFMRRLFWVYQGLELQITNPAMWVLPIFASLAVVAVMFVALVSLRQTLSRCRVMPPQLLRVMAYSLCSGGVYSALLLAAVQVIEGLSGRLSVLVYGGAWIIVCGLALTPGLKVYLRIPHAFAVAISAPLIALLLTTTVFFVTIVLTWNP